MLVVIQFKSNIYIFVYLTNSSCNFLSPLISVQALHSWLLSIVLDRSFDLLKRRQICLSLLHECHSTEQKAYLG